MSVWNIPDLRSYPHANWMANLPETLRAQPLYNLTLPATHNSGATTIRKDVDLNSNADSFYNYARSFLFWSGLADFMKRWTVTQNFSITRQLKSGVRQLDLRVAEERGTGRLFISHTFACQKLSSACKSIAAFLNEHPGEVVIVYVKPDWEHREALRSESRGDRVTACLEKYLGKWMLPKTKRGKLNSKMTLNNLVKSGHRAIVSYGYVHTPHPNIWQRERPTTGTLEPDPDRKLKQITNWIAELESRRRKSNAGYTADAVVTPDTNTIRNALATEAGAVWTFWDKDDGNTSLQRLNTAIQAKLEYEFSKWDLARVQSLELDFINEKWAKRIIDLNKR